uniref:Uncharacterized protein n=1 Tax=Pseudonaja textilis TaxID=8673 RepID=A0A670Z765_PSETE
MAPRVSLASQAGKSRESEGVAILNEENATHLDLSQDQVQIQGWQRQKLLEGLFLGEAEEDQVSLGPPGIFKEGSAVTGGRWEGAGDYREGSSVWPDLVSLGLNWHF